VQALLGAGTPARLQVADKTILNQTPQPGSVRREPYAIPAIDFPPFGKVADPSVWNWSDAQGKHAPAV
jgi:hypothetical protein